ncbi:MAG: branched-chain amino acid ABC transporter permease [Deltaproteobacteria bacterium]|nr:branched-chain amino acid ABC transporter permease [Deltaproteobacteria bacterium]
MIIGAVYAVIGVGFTLIFGIMQILNFAYGELFMIAAYLAYFGVTVFMLPLWLILILAMAVMFLIGFGIEKAVILPVRMKIPDWVVPVILVTLALQIILQNLALILEGGNFLGIPAYIMGSLRVGNFSVSYERLLMFGICVATLAGIWLLLRKTKLGLALQAVSQNRDAAILSGINTNTVYALCFGLSGLLISIPGVLMMPHLYAYPTVGQVPIMKAFAVTLFGGMGNVAGAIIGGFILGVAETLAAGYISALVKDGVAFAVMILILVFYPAGVGTLLTRRKLG